MVVFKSLSNSINQSSSSPVHSSPSFLLPLLLLLHMLLQLTSRANSLPPTEKKDASLPCGAQCTVPIGAGSRTGAISVNVDSEVLDFSTDTVIVSVVSTVGKAVGVGGAIVAAWASTSAAIEGSHGFIVAHACQVAAWLVSACAL